MNENRRRTHPSRNPHQITKDREFLGQIGLIFRPVAGSFYTLGPSEITAEQEFKSWVVDRLAESFYEGAKWPNSNVALDIQKNWPGFKEA